MVQNNGLNPKEAKEIYDAYMKGFPGVAKYQNIVEKKSLIKDTFL